MISFFSLFSNNEDPEGIYDTPTEFTCRKQVPDFIGTKDCGGRIIKRRKGTMYCTKCGEEFILPEKK